MPDITIEQRIDDRVDQLVTSPAGCAFLLIAEGDSLQPPDVADPVTAFLVAGAAVEAISPWNAYGNGWLKAEALRHGSRLRPLAHAILGQPDVAWWWERLRRDAQLWTTQANHEPFPLSGYFPTPTAPPNRNERYAQHPDHAVYTSTAYDDLSALLVAGLTNLGDWIVEPPIERKRVHVLPDAWVVEIHNADDWHDFVRRYPAHGFHGTHWWDGMPPDTPWGQGGGIVLDWSAIARDWDGVHISLLGMLLIEQVRVVSDAGWPEHWGQSGERTLWLREVFTDIEAIEPMMEMTDPGRAAHFPMALIPPDQRHPSWPVPPSPD